jgi:hypothetical protein
LYIRSFLGQGWSIDHFGDVAREQRTSLIVYVAVLAYSAALGAYFLLIRRDARLWGARSN